jgi:hypothetical protein
MVLTATAKEEKRNRELQEVADRRKERDRQIMTNQQALASSASSASSSSSSSSSSSPIVRKPSIANSSRLCAFPAQDDSNFRLYKEQQTQDYINQAQIMSSSSFLRAWSLQDMLNRRAKPQNTSDNEGDENEGGEDDESKLSKKLLSAQNSHYDVERSFTKDAMVPHGAGHRAKKPAEKDDEPNRAQNLQLEEARMPSENSVYATIPFDKEDF